MSKPVYVAADALPSAQEWVATFPRTSFARDVQYPDAVAIMKTATGKDLLVGDLEVGSTTEVYSNTDLRLGKETSPGSGVVSFQNVTEPSEDGIAPANRFRSAQRRRRALQRRRSSFGAGLTRTNRPTRPDRNSGIEIRG